MSMAHEAKEYSRFLGCSCNMIRRSCRKITQFYENSLREAGIKPTQLTILATLAILGPTQLTLLADKLVLERTGLTRNLSVLERNGWVQIETGSEDSRQRVVSLTKKGYAQLDHASPYWEKAQSAVSKELGPETMSELKTSLNKITEALSG